MCPLLGNAILHSRCFKIPPVCRPDYRIIRSLPVGRIIRQPSLGWGKVAPGPRLDALVVLRDVDINKAVFPKRPDHLRTPLDKLAILLEGIIPGNPDRRVRPDRMRWVGAPDPSRNRFDPLHIARAVAVTAI